MADAPLTSPSWYRVADLRPRLRSHTRVSRHEYRGERWYVLEDRISRRSHRFNPVAHQVIGLMDGRRSMDELWQAAVDRFGDEAPSQDDLIKLLGQLHLADLVQCEVSPDVDELLRRSHRLARKKQLATWMSPLSIKFPLIDPDRMLERWAPWFRPLFGTFGLLLWLSVVGAATFLAVQHWTDLTQDISDRILAPENLVIMLLVFPVLKAFHEFGHACAVKAWGGEVHEMGVMLLVLMPVPYVDASASSSFPQKYRRVLVGAAGMVVELFVASIALFFWLEMEPGVMRAVMFNVMLIAGISTVLFNANPLLRFDGYYIFADLIEMPNLRARAGQHMVSLVERRLFGLAMPAGGEPVRERAWLLFFQVASFIYRMMVTFGIALFIAGAYFFIGVALAIFAVFMSVVLPILKGIAYIAVHPKLRRHRLRAALSMGGLTGAVVVVLFLIPVPMWTNAEGVIWVPEQAIVRAGADGFISKMIATPGSQVRRGEPLLESADPVLPLTIRVLEAQEKELATRYQAERVQNEVKAQITLEQAKVVDADLNRAREKEGERVVVSPADGEFIVPTPQDLPDRYVKKGEQIGYVLTPSTATARVVVPQQSIDLVRNHTTAVRVLLAERLGEPMQARVQREIPGASDRLPSLALAQSGGGSLALNPAEGREPKTLQTHFEFELELPTAQPVGIGGRVHVRFEHGTEPLAQQLYRSVRQLFLQRFAV